VNEHFLDSGAQKAGAAAGTRVRGLGLPDPGNALPGPPTRTNTRSAERTGPISGAWAAVAAAAAACSCSGVMCSRTKADRRLAISFSAAGDH
jgi:hypothetical protein